MMNNDKKLKELDAKIKEFEEEELKGQASSTTYSVLLILYLTKFELANAKFLWKRIPANIKNGNIELASIWEIGQKLWLRDYPETYKALQKQWSENLRPHMEKLSGVIREQALNLVAKAYFTITYDELAALAGVPVNEALQFAHERQWDIDSSNNLVLPKQPEHKCNKLLTSDEQMGQLADYVAFLEN